MNDIFQHLSGLVPGGIYLLIFILFTINVLLYFLYKKSKIITKDVYVKNTIKYSSVILGIYIFLWIYLRPVQLPDKIGVLPFQKGTSIDLVLCEVLEQQIKDNLSDGYFIHPWDWLYQTANKDSFQLIQYRRDLAKKLNVSVIISGEIKEKSDGIIVELNIDRFSRLIGKTIEVKSYQYAVKEILEEISQSTNVINSPIVLNEPIEIDEFEKYSRAKLEYLNKNYDRVIDLLDESSFLYKLQLARANLKKGIQKIQKNNESSLKLENNNLYFQRVHNLLIPYIKKGQDTPEMNLLLGQMYLYKKEYVTAETILKQALFQNPYDARIYYSMSFLHIDRLKEIGFKNRLEILDYAVRLDPGFVDAVYDLAYVYYDTGTAIRSGYGTIKAHEVLEKYLYINSNEKRILSLLGRIYLQTKFTLKGLEIYKKLLLLDPESAETNYNLGVCYFHMKEYEKSSKHFEKAIQINDHKDSYLYLGAINRVIGDNEKALYYYRERIKRKDSADDKYAKQAMRGIRLILHDQYEEEQKTLNNEDKSIKSD